MAVEEKEVALDKATIKIKKQINAVDNHENYSILTWKTPIPSLVKILTNICLCDCINTINMLQMFMMGMMKDLIISLEKFKRMS